MNRRELISKTASFLREMGTRKLVPLPKQNFYISDDSGNSKKFTIRPIDRGVLYTTEDVECILDACMNVIEETLKTGEPISIRNYASLNLVYKPERYVIDINNREEKIKIPARFIPKFEFGKKLKMAAKAYTDSVKDKNVIKASQVESFENTTIKEVPDDDD